MAAVSGGRVYGKAVGLQGWVVTEGVVRFNIRLAMAERQEKALHNVGTITPGSDDGFPVELG